MFLRVDDDSINVGSERLPLQEVAPPSEGREGAFIRDGLHLPLWIAPPTEGREDAVSRVGPHLLRRLTSPSEGREGAFIRDGLHLPL